MQNTYIIDTFLSAWAWLILAMLYISVGSLTKKLNANMTSATFQVIFGRVFKLSIGIAIPFIVIFLFLLWRFGALIYDCGCFGAGAIGLLIIMTVAGVVLIWLKSVLTLMTSGEFAIKSPDNTSNSPKSPQYDGYGRAI